MDEKRPSMGAFLKMELMIAFFPDGNRTYLMSLTMIRKISLTTNFDPINIYPKWIYIFGTEYDSLYVFYNKSNSWSKIILDEDED